MTTQPLSGLTAETPTRSSSVVTADGGGQRATVAGLLGLIELTDFPAGGATVGQALVWNGTVWVPGAVGAGSLAVGSGLTLSVGGTLSSSGVLTLNGRAGSVTLGGADVTGALGYTPVSNAGGALSGAFSGGSFASSVSASTVTAAGALGGITAPARSLGTRAADCINVLDWGVVADGATDQSAALQALINAYPSGATIHLSFPREAASTGWTLYALASPVRSNGRIVRASFDDGADVLSTGGFLSVDRIGLWRGAQRYESTANPYSGSSTGLPVGYGPHTALWNYAIGPNVNYGNWVITDTRFAATNTTTAGAAAGGQLALGFQRVFSAPTLLDATGMSMEFSVINGPMVSAEQSEVANLTTSMLFAEWDLYGIVPGSAWTDQAGYRTPVSGLLIAAGTGGNASPWGQNVAGDVGACYRVGGAATGSAYTSQPSLNDRWPFYPVVFGALNPSPVSTSDSIVITDNAGATHTVVLGGGAGAGLLADVAASINAALVPNVQAQVSTMGASSPFNRLAIYSTLPRNAGTFSLANGSGTPLATLGISPGLVTAAGKVGANALVVSFPVAVGAQLVAQNAAGFLCGSQVTFNTNGTSGDVVSMAASINAANILGVSALVSSWGGSCRLVIKCFISQQTNGLVVVDSSGAPFQTIGIPSGVWFPNTVPNAWAGVISETVGAGAVLATGDAITVGYSAPASNTTQAASITVVVGAGSLGVSDAAAAFNTACFAQGWATTTTLSQAAGQGTKQLVLTSVAGLNVGMILPQGSLFQANTIIQDVHVATSTVFLTNGIQQAATSGISISFGWLRADSPGVGSTGAALRIQNMLGGSLWLSDHAGKPLEKLGIYPGQRWPGAMPAGAQIGYEVGYGALAAGGVGHLLSGSLPSQIADPVQWPANPVRVRQAFRSGIRLDEATLNDGNALTIAASHVIAWGSPEGTQHALGMAAGTLTVDGILVSPVTSVFGRSGAVALASADVTGALGFAPANAATAGTVSSVVAGSGLTGGTISVSGTISLASTITATLSGGTISGGIVTGTLTNSGTISGGTQSPATLVLGASTVNVTGVATTDAGGNALLAYTAGGSTAGQISQRLSVKGGYLQFSDTGTTSPNAAGAGALDLQLQRSAATQVANGNDAVAIGAHNTASGTRATTIGYNNTATAQGSVVVGQNGNDNGLTGAFAIGSAANVAAYPMTLQVYAACASGTATRMTADGNAAGSANVLNLVSNTVAAGALQVIARNPANGDVAYWTIPLAYSNVAGSIVVSNPGTGAIAPGYAGSSLSTAAITISGDNTNGGLTVTGVPPAAAAMHVLGVFSGAQVG